MLPSHFSWNRRQLRHFFFLWLRSVVCSCSCLTSSFSYVKRYPTNSENIALKCAPFKLLPLHCIASHHVFAQLFVYFVTSFVCYFFTKFRFISFTFFIHLFSCIRDEIFFCIFIRSSFRLILCNG